MLPTQLTAESFSAYPAQARELATKHIEKLQACPELRALLLKELIVYDFKFPMERRDLTRQTSLPRQPLVRPVHSVLAPFAQLRLSQELEKTNWVGNPAVFTEQLTAHVVDHA